MRRLDPAEIVGFERYTQLRDAYRERVIAYKRARRMPVGEHASLVFEDRETLRFQIQEMLYVERIRDPDGIAREVAVYNELVPEPGELSATLMIEITDPSRIRAELDRLIGLHEHLHLVLGDGGGAEAVRARFDPRQLESDRIAAVQYVRFALPPPAQRHLADPGVPARIRVDHANYPREEAIPPPLRASLIRGLERDPEPLLGEDGVA